MQKSPVHNSLLFQSLRVALGTQQGFFYEPSAEEWRATYLQAGRQSLLGICFYAIGLAYPDADRRIPKELYLKWLYQAESIRSLNQRHYELSRELTEKFKEQKVRTAILKGQANSRIYPDRFVRQTGDVDLWVDLNRADTVAALSRMGLLDNVQYSRHELTLPRTVFGAEVEIHFDYIQDCNNPFANKRIRRVLGGGLLKTGLVPEGFFVPSNKFALLMQLSHIRKHFIGLGVGLRQLVDYFALLQSASGSDRAEVSTLLKPLGLSRIASAVMWILAENLGLDERYWICAPDCYRGRILLQELLADGNFGKFAERRRGAVYLWWARNRLRAFRLLFFDFPEMSWYLLKYWASFLRLMPERMAALKRTLKGARKGTWKNR